MTKTERVKKATLARGHAQFRPLEAVQDALICDAEPPSIQIADKLALEAPEEFKIDVARKLFFRLVCAVRRMTERAKHEQFSLPGLGHLKVRIAVDKGKVRDLLDATKRGVQLYVWHLNAAKPKTAEKREAKALLEFMRIASKKQRGITVRRAIELFGPIPPLPETEEKKKKAGKSE